MRRLGGRSGRRELRMLRRGLRGAKGAIKTGVQHQQKVR